MAFLKEVTCPHCKKGTSLSQNNPFRPFCSERCKLIDLGGWASERYKIQSDDPVENENAHTEDPDALD